MISPFIWGVPVVMLTIALAPLPYGYYTLLRFIVCGAAGYLAWLHFEVQKIHIWTIFFAIIAILFNPFIPIYLSRDVWRIIDITCAIILIANLISMRKKIEKRIYNLE